MSEEKTDALLNAERAFHEAQADYSGMDVQVLSYSGRAGDGTAHTCLCDLLLPAGREREEEQARPLILFLHGGGFHTPCDRRQTYVSLFARAFLAAGYAVAAPDYPVYESAREAEEAGEKKAALIAGEAAYEAHKMVLAQAGRYGIDPARPVLMGGSAGAMAAFSAAARHPGVWSVLVNLWGPPEKVPDASSFPPVYSVHGTADELVPFAREAPLQAALSAAGIPHELFVLPGEGHTPIGRMAEYLPGIFSFLERYR